MCYSICGPSIYYSVRVYIIEAWVTPYNRIPTQNNNKHETANDSRGLTTQNITNNKKYTHSRRVKYKPIKNHFHTLNI
jgi:hypothetical protein